MLGEIIPDIQSCCRVSLIAWNASLKDMYKLISAFDLPSRNFAISESQFLV